MNSELKIFTMFVSFVFHGLANKDVEIQHRNESKYKPNVGLENLRFEMIREEIVLLMCGSFNPITNMHLRMLEIARDHLMDLGYHVKQGYISPVHDKYGKADLASINHRINMIKNAIKSSDWIHLSSWESEQNDWSPTFQVLKHHQDRLNGLLNDTNINGNSSHDVNGNSFDYRITVKLVCGADVLNSFSVPGLWKESDIQGILTEHGIVVITRCGYDIDKIIYENDRLFANKRHIHIVKEHIENTISSTGIRKACMRGLSIKYLVQDGVERYIKDNKLYSHNKYKYNSTVDNTIGIPAEIFNDYKKYPTNTSNSKIPVVGPAKKQKRPQRRKKPKEVQVISKRLRKR